MSANGLPTLVLYIPLLQIEDGKTMPLFSSPTYPALRGRGGLLEPITAVFG